MAAGGGSGEDIGVGHGSRIRNGKGSKRSRQDKSRHATREQGGPEQQIHRIVARKRRGRNRGDDEAAAVQSLDGSVQALCEDAPIQAIEPERARTNMDECFYYLDDSQVIHNDVTVCPPLVNEGRRKRELAVAAPRPADPAVE